MASVVILGSTSPKGEFPFRGVRKDTWLEQSRFAGRGLMEELEVGDIDEDPLLASPLPAPGGELLGLLR